MVIGMESDNTIDTVSLSHSIYSSNPTFDCLISKRLERNHGLRVLNAIEHLHLVGDEVADIVLLIEVEFRENVVIAGGGIDFRGDFGIREGRGYLIGFAKLAFDLHEERLHCALLSSPGLTR